MTTKFYKHPLAIIILVVLALLAATKLFDLRFRASFQQISATEPYGFEPVDCWFDKKSAPPRTECYYMHVPEDHAKSNDDAIKFPVVVFRSDSVFSTKAPVLHLGAGGPGAPMYLDWPGRMNTIWENHNALSIDQGRDLFIIDPRGTGLSKPLLMCDTFVESETQRLANNLSFEEEWESTHKDYVDCIDRFKQQGVNLSTYNSLSIANDIEMMRIAAKVDQWVFVGVSYAATYAQIIATQYPESVEAMILDSATFPNLKSHHNFFDNTMGSYLALYNYCELIPACSTPLQNIEARIWALHNTLNLDPIFLTLNHPEKDGKIDVLLNGERFISALQEGTYGEDIFSDLPSIIIELESGYANTIVPYLEDHISYLLDTTYGDVSSSSHYCYEDKPYTDFESIRAQINQLPEGYIRDTVLLSLELPDYCDEMQIKVGDPVVSLATQTEIPTLFLHGELDTITPLSDVTQQRASFTQSRVVTYPVSHDVISSDSCAEVVAAKFIRNTAIDQEKLNCQ